MPGQTMGSLSSSFSKLQRLAQSFDEIGSLGERRQEALVELAMELGATAIPLCIRELGAKEQAPRRADESEASEAHLEPGQTRWGWACTLLLVLGTDDALRPRIDAALETLAHAPGSSSSARARDVLAELDDGSGPSDSPRVAGHDPVAGGAAASVPDESLNAELVEQLQTLPRRAPDIAHAGHLLATQLEPDDMLAVIDQLGAVDPARALDLMDELRIRNDLDESEHAQVRRLRAEICALSGLPARPPTRLRSRPPAQRRDEHDAAKIDTSNLEISVGKDATRDGSGRDVPMRSVPPGGQRVATAYVGSHPSGRCLVVATCRSATSLRHRVIYLLITDDDRVVDGLYREDAGPCDIDTEILGPVRARGHRVATHSALHVRELVLRAAHRTREQGGPLPPAFYLGRDLLGIYDEHTDPAYSHPGLGAADRAILEAGNPASNEIGLLVDRALGLLDAGKPERARPVLERLLVRWPDSIDGNEALARCLVALDEHRSAREYARVAARLAPDEARHHWNLAAIAHLEERPGSCYLALLDYLDLAGDRDGATGSTTERRRSAHCFVTEYERIARLEYPDVDPEAVARADDLVYIAREHLQDGHALKAIVGLEQALATVPEHYPAATWLGIAHRERGQRNRAIEYLRRALACRPGYLEARQALEALVSSPREQPA